MIEYDGKLSVRNNLLRLKSEVLNTDTFNKNDLLKFIHETIENLDAEPPSETRIRDKELADLRKALARVNPILPGDRIIYRSDPGVVIKKDGDFISVLVSHNGNFKVNNHVGAGTLRRFDADDEQFEEEFLELANTLSCFVKGVEDDD